MVRTVDYKDPRRLETIRLLQSKAKDSPVWKNVVKELSRSRSNRTEVNLERINKSTKKGDIVIVPGKILGDGSLDHEITVAAFKFSKSAIEKLKGSGCTTLNLDEFASKNQNVKDVKLMK